MSIFSHHNYAHNIYHIMIAFNCTSVLVYKHLLTCTHDKYIMKSTPAVYFIARYQFHIDSIVHVTDFKVYFYIPK